MVCSRAEQYLDEPRFNHLVEDRGGQHTRIWGKLEIGRELCVGVQRARCFPFSSDKAWEHNPMKYVAIIPPKEYTGLFFSQFDMADERHRRQLWFGRN
jgi:hypothetical protein